MEVHTVKLELTTVQLTLKVFKQLRRITFSEVSHLRANGEFAEGVVLGWIHGAAVGDEWNRYLLVRLGEGEYGTIECLESTTKKHKQIFLR